MSALALLLLFAATPAPTAERPPTLAERTASLERHEGFLPFYWDAAKGALLLELAPGPEEFLYSAGLAGGAGTLDVSLDRGQLGDAGICRFERVGPRVLLRRLQTAHRAGGEDKEARRAVDESFPSAVLAALPIVAEGPSRVLVDATDFLLKDPLVLQSLKQAKQGQWSQDASRGVPYLERSGAFPRNTEIEVVLTFVGEDVPPALAGVLPDGRTLSLNVHHTFLRLPEPGFVPRRLDARVGMIPQGFKDYAAPIAEPLQRFVASRWRVSKDHPIVYYLDRAIPEPERSAIRSAALWWNHAFAEAGLGDHALVIEDLPASASFLDARYSGIEWIHRDERSWSIGEFQADPRTGEILHAVARIDSHRRRTTARMWRNLQRPGGLAAGDPNLDEQAFVLQRLSYLSAHEVGHTLGLEHNFAATTFGWGSVMDYLGAHIEPRNGALDLSDAYPKDIGSYDRLAIRWAYTEGATADQLDAIVRDGIAQGVVYPVPSDARWAEYDWGPDPVAWLRTTQQVRRIILDRFGPGQLAPGEPLYDLQERLSLAYLYHRFGIQAAQQLVGGQYHLSPRAGDGQAPAAWVPAAAQGKALDLLLSALAPDALDLPDRVLAALGPEPQDLPATREAFASDAGGTFSLATAARALADLVVRPLLDPQRDARLALQTAPDALTLSGTLDRIRAATWGAPEDAKGRHRLLQRAAQRSVLDGVLDLAARSDAAPDVRAAAMAQVVTLQAALHLRHSADAPTEAHLRLAERDLREFLEHPERRTPRPAVPAPPGRPIGELGDGQD